MILSAAGILLALLVALLALLYASEDRLIYFPQKALDARPEDYGLTAEDLAVETADGVRLSGWWIRGRGELVLLFFHGNAGNVSHRLERARDLVAALGLDVVLVDYRGYGESGGKPSENGLYEDGEAIWRAVAARGVAPGRIVMFGESLGCAVAIETALRRPCRALILEAPFLSVPEMAKSVYPFLPSFLVRTKFDNGSKAARLAVPKLLVAAERDEVVPPQQTRRLFALAAPPKELFVIPGARHNDASLVGGKPYLEALRRFLEGAEPPGTA
ncbi:MAG: alpha/beta hydrolase, partial [Thermoanaerobaculia bacterium]